MTHWMIDLETFDTAPTAAIVSLCIKEFDPNVIEVRASDREYATAVSLASCILAGLTMSKNTIEFWRQQPEAAIDKIIRNSVPLHGALIALQVLITKDDYVWSHGASFDIPILENAYLATGLTVPWHYRNVLDTRTIFYLWTQKTGRIPELKRQHDARLDCIDQIIAIQSAIAGLQLDMAKAQAETVGQSDHRFDGVGTNPDLKFEDQFTKTGPVK